MAQKTELRGREYSRYGPSQTHSSDEAGVRNNLRSQTILSGLNHEGRLEQATASVVVMKLSRDR